MLKKAIFCLIFIHFQAIVFGQQTDELFINNFGQKDYKASNSNWDIAVGHDNIMFYANLGGLLTYNGAQWNYTPSSSPLISLHEDKGQIYYGSNMDFGYVDVGLNGALVLKSLSQRLEKRTSPIWNITSCDNFIFFVSNDMIYQWNGQDLEEIPAESGKFNTTTSCLNANLYLTKEPEGLIKLKEGKYTALNGTSSIASDHLIIINNDKNGKALSLITRESGLLSYYNGQLESNESNTTNINRATILNLPSYKYAFATLNGGILLSDSALHILKRINKQSGLYSNAIKNVHKDHHGGLWSAMQEGIAFIEVNSPWTTFNRESISGTITSICTVDSILTLVGTTEGLYKIRNNVLTKDNNFTDRIWYIKKFKQQPLISSVNGLFKIDSKGVQTLNNRLMYPLTIQMGTNTIAAHSSGISTINADFSDIITNIYSARETWVDIEKFNSSSFVLTAKYKGVYVISDIETEKPTVNLYDQQNGLPDVEEIHLLKHNNNLLFTTSKGLYEFKNKNPDSTKFIPYNADLKITRHIKHAEKDDSGNIYFTFQNGLYDQLEKYEIQPNGEYKRLYRPFKRLPDMEITEIHIKPNGELLVGGSEGLFKYNPLTKKDYNQPFSTVINRIFTSDSLIHAGHYTIYNNNNITPVITTEQRKNLILSLPYSHNNIMFEYAATSYELPNKNQYSYYLKNNDQTWSKWSTETKKEYTNLPAGDYTFMVKSKNIYDTIGRTATYQFTILPPWYQTTWAYTGFVILSILFVWFVSLAYTYRVRMHRRKLKLIVADRTFEVISQKKEIESQNLLLKDQFKEISKQKDEIQGKNIELQQSQEEILTINEKLKELNQHLEKKVDQRTQKIKATLIKLKKTNKELDTFIYRASHDLKGPISRIHGLTSLAKLEAIDSSNTKYYDLIERAALDMQGLLSKLSHAYEIMNKDVVFETIDIPFLLSEIRNAVKFLDLGTKYTFNIDEKLSLQSDKYLLKIILENVIENALIFRQRNKDHEVSIMCFEENDKFHFQIADNGIGINPDHRNSIFEMFFRGSDQSKGSGLGLYITKLALDKIQGSIEMESTLYQYSKFTITIPLR
ncbi:MAG: ATP-binding protein [Fulvivirga sp.]